MRLHSKQINLFKNHNSVATVGSLREQVMMESLVSFIEQILNSRAPREALDQFADIVSEVFGLKSSVKHMRHHLKEELDDLMQNDENYESILHKA